MKIVIATDEAQPNDVYRGALLCAGALPEEVVFAMPEKPLPQELDGLLLAGGADVSPSRYGETQTVPNLWLNPERDALDLTLFHEAEKHRVPVFGICRGLQLINVALGGTLWQDLPAQRDRGVNHEYERDAGFPPGHPAHVVRGRGGVALPDSLLATFGAAVEATVNSRHHQAVKDLANGLVPVAASSDDLIEAFLRPGEPLLVAVQWHPEDLVRDASQKALFRAFVEAARAHAKRSGRTVKPLIEVSLEGAIPLVTLNRPERRNAFAGGMREMLAGTIEALGQDPTVPAILLTGAGGAFSAGGDIEVMRALAEAHDVEGFRELLQAGGRVVRSILRSPKPVIAVIEGPAVGAGMNLALACDVRVASAIEGSEAYFGQPFTKIGLAPDWGGSFFLPELVGPGAAADLVFSADRISAARAQELGIVDYLAEDGPALAMALARASVYAERPAAALAAAKLNLNADRIPRLERALERETETQIELFSSGDLARRLAAAPSRRSESREN